GEVFAFVFFGLVATAGTAFVQTAEFTRLAFGAATPVGLLASALLVANNLRDIAQDRESGKLTLAVRLGERRSAWFYAALVLAAIGAGAWLGMARPWALLTLASLLLAAPAVWLALSPGPKAPLLNHTARLHSVFGVLLTVGLALSAPPQGERWSVGAVWLLRPSGMW
ncbi:MAG: UbiA family prenyltransferase, partial [bacterium]|nr:UbiA family prenyltransferase [bacterium]